MKVTIIHFDSTIIERECESFEFRTNHVSNWIKLKFKNEQTEIIHNVATIQCKEKQAII